MDAHTKHEATSQVYSVDNSRHSYGQAPTTNQPWKTGRLTNVPWKGLASLLIAVAGIAVSIGILIISNNDPVRSWRVQPTVYLSIASTITNILLTYAMRKALDVAWWRKATQDNTKIADLHRSWDFGTSVGKALRAGRHVNMIAIGCILVALAPINGPLLQRASTVTTGFVERSIDVKVQIAETLPEGYTGYESGRSHIVSLLTPNFTAVVQGANTGSPINFISTGCRGNCLTTVRGAGFGVECSTSTQPFNLEIEPQEDGSLDTDQQAVANGTQAFGSTITWDYSAKAQLRLGVQYKDRESCKGALQIRNCTLLASTVDYPVIIDGNKSTISLSPASTIFDDKVLSSSIKDDKVLGPTTLGGLAKAMKDAHDSTATLRFIGAKGYELLTSGATANIYAIPPDQSPSMNCSLKFADPSNDLLQAIRDLMFRAAIAASDPTTSQTVPAQESLQQPIYESHFLYLGLATLFSGIAVIAIFPSFLGWWCVGRKTSMSPIETGKAFRAPMLVGTDPNAEVKDMVRSIGERGVKYGAVSSPEGGNEWLGFNQPQLVRRPGQGVRFVG